MEAKPLAHITESKMIDFVRRAIVCRFGIPKVLIANNIRQFIGIQFEKFCEDQGIPYHLTSVVHPQANGEAKVTKRTILQEIKKRLSKAKET